MSHLAFEIVEYELHSSKVNNSKNQTNKKINRDSGDSDSLSPFRLKCLTSPHLRYEVIYKNLLRDMRKFYLQEFSSYSNYKSKPKK